MEVSPRGGGCRIAELQEMAMGVPLIENEIRKAVDMPLVPMNEHQIEGHWCEMIIHNRREQQGVLKSIDIDKEFQDKYIRLLQLTSKPGDYVEPFTGANKSLGDMFMQFDSREELDRITDNIGKYLKINLE